MCQLLSRKVPVRAAVLHWLSVALSISLACAYTWCGTAPPGFQRWCDRCPAGTLSLRECTVSARLEPLGHWHPCSLSEVQEPMLAKHWLLAAAAHGHKELETCRGMHSTEAE